MIASQLLAYTENRLLAHIDAQLSRAQEEIAVARQMIAKESDHAGLFTWLACLGQHIETAERHIKESQVMP